MSIFFCKKMNKMCPVSIIYMMHKNNGKIRSSRFCTRQTCFHILYNRVCQNCVALDLTKLYFGCIFGIRTGQDINVRCFGSFALSIGLLFSFRDHFNVEYYLHFGMFVRQPPHENIQWPSSVRREPMQFLLL